MKAFLLIERHSIRWYGEKGEKPEVKGKGILCAVLAESVDKLPEITGGEYDVILFDEGQRPVIRLGRELFTPHSEKIVKYEKGPIHLYIGEENEGTYLFIVEVPLLQPIQATA